MPNHLRFFLFALLVACWARSVWAAPTIVPADCFNLQIVEIKNTPTGTVIALTPQRPGFAHNWFAGRLKGVPTRGKVTLKIEMEGNDTDNRADVGKWKGLHPVYSYADPMRYESYVGYSRDARGVWVSNDLLEGEARTAGNGVVPRQNSIAPALAMEFLSADGASWFPWQEISDTKTEKGNVFSMSHEFSMPQISFAMRVPFTPTFLQQWTQKLQKAELPGVFVDDLGKTGFGRPISCIRVEDPVGVADVRKQKTVVVFAREHATEHDSSWSALGMLTYLIGRSREADQARAQMTWLFVLIQDQDGAAASRFSGLTTQWAHENGGLALPEIFAYARYFRDWADKERTLDLVMSLHNVESREAPNLMSPFAQDKFWKQITALNKDIYASAKSFGYTTDKPEPKGRGLLTARLYGWITKNFGSMDMAFEVNGRNPDNPLTNAQLQGLGAVMAQNISAWMASDKGEKRHDDALKFLAQRDLDREAYFAENGVEKDDYHQTLYLMTQGY